MQDQLLINHREILIKDNRSSKTANAISDAIDDQLRQFFMMGARQVARDVNSGLLTMMKANVHNSNLSDADYRQLTETLIEQWQEKVRHIYGS